MLKMAQKEILESQLVERGLSKLLDEGLHISEVVTDASKALIALHFLLLIIGIFKYYC